METVRIDKWLWAARFFKTRALAADACEIGRIESNTHRAKPSRDVRPGDHLRITNEAGIFEIEVLTLTESRGPRRRGPDPLPRIPREPSRPRCRRRRTQADARSRRHDGRPTFQARPARHQQTPRPYPPLLDKRTRASSTPAPWPQRPSHAAAASRPPPLAVLFTLSALCPGSASRYAPVIGRGTLSR